MAFKALLTAQRRREMEGKERKTEEENEGINSAEDERRERDGFGF